MSRSAATLRTPVIGALPSPALVVLAIVSTQLGASIAVHLFDHIGPLGTVFLRVGFSALVLVALFRPRIAGHPRDDLVLAAVFGLSLAFMNLFFYEAIDRIPLGIAVTIEFVGPLGVAVVGSRRPRDGLWVLLAAIGIVLLADGGSGSVDALGVVYALLAGVMWFTYILLSARTGRVFPSGKGLAIGMAVGALAVAPFGIAGAGSDLLDVRWIAAGAALALLSSAVPYSFELEALRRLPEHVFGILMSMEPAVAALVGFFVLGQDLRLRDVVAIGLVAGACAGASLSARRPAVAAEA
ncbi:MAG: EamA family transporter [Gaiellaceae bacterium]